MRSMLAILAMALAAPLAAQSTSSTSVVGRFDEQITIEYYYRIKWGQAGAFLKLYRKNHEPLLKEMQKRGFIVSMKTEEPYTHLAGGPRWDLRVTITYRDAKAAVGNESGGWNDIFAEIERKMFPDKATFVAEEAQRMGLLEEHWDVIVNRVGD